MLDWPVVKLLLYIYDNGGEVENFRGLMRTLDYSFAKLDRARRILLQYGLIKEEVIKAAPQVLKLKLTDKGVEAAKLLKQLIDLLQSQP